MDVPKATHAITGHRGIARGPAGIGTPYSVENLALREHYQFVNKSR